MKGDRLDTEELLILTTQLLQAVAFIHEAGYADGGMVISNQLLFLELTFCRPQC